MKKLAIASLIASSAFFVGCEVQETNTPEASPALEQQQSTLEVPAVQEKKTEPLSIVTSFYPLAFFTEQIVGEKAEFINLSGDQSPHSYKISPQDRASLENADLVIYHGIGLESWTEDVIPELEEKNIAVLEASHDLQIIAHEDEHDENTEEEHDDHREEDEHEDEGEHDKHDHGEFDPHTWIDPVLAMETAQKIANELINIDPDNSDEYEKNLKILTQKLKDLDSQYVSALANCSQTESLISHDAFGYLEARYNFSLHAIAGLSPSDEPSAKLLSQLKEEVESEGVTHILTEENNVKAYAQMIADETGLQMLPINPMGITPTQGDYFTVSKANISALSTALGCQ